MKFVQFSEAIDTIYDCFGRKRPDISSKENLFDFVKSIPAAALDGIVKHIIKQFDSLPKNIPNAFKKAYSAWLEEHPERALYHQKTHCSTCGGSGRLHFSRFNRLTGLPYTNFALCKDCQNCFIHYPRETVLPRLTRAEVEALEGFICWEGWLARHGGNDVESSPIGPQGPNSGGHELRSNY